MFSFFRKVRKNDAPNIMMMVPKVNCESRPGKEKDTLDLLIPRFKQNWLSKLVPPKKDPNIVIHLDELGTYFWNSIDGKRTVLDIGRMMQESFPDEMKEGLERAGLFAQGLYRQNFIKFEQEDD